MSPAEVVVDTFGGVRATARAADVNPSTVCRWLQPRLPKKLGGTGGTGGLVPAGHRQRLIEAAAKLGRHLTIEHLTLGKPGITRRIVWRLR